MSRLPCCVDESFNYQALCERASDAAKALRIEVEIRRLPKARRDLGSGQTLWMWGAFVDHDHEWLYRSWLDRLEGSWSSQQLDEDDMAAIHDAEEERRREIGDELSDSTDDYARSDESGWFYPEKDP